MCWDFAHALLELAAWLQAGEDHAIAAGSRAVLKSGCRPLLDGRFPVQGVRFGGLKSDQFHLA
jgi:hypothetical protein